MELVVLVYTFESSSSTMVTVVPALMESGCMATELSEDESPTLDDAIHLEMP